MSLRSAPLPLTIERPEEVEALLCERPELRAYMEEAARRLVEIFGPDATIQISVMTYIEEPDEPVLEMIVTTPVETAHALIELHAFDRDWLIHQPPSVQTQMLIDVMPA